MDNANDIISKGFHINLILNEFSNFHLRERTPKESVSFPIKVNNKPYFCNLA